jgi:putative membrane protein
MQRKSLSLIALLVVALALAGCKKSEQSNTTSGTSDTTGTGASGGTVSSLSTADKETMMKFAQGGMTEVKLGSMAAEKGVSADVRNFGSRMVSDHGKANDELKALATNKGVALPSDVNGEQQKTIDKLSKLSGKAFDKEYVKAMVDDHEKDAKEFEKASTDAKDPDFRAWCAKTLPMIQDHLRMIKEIQAKMK